MKKGFVFGLGVFTGIILTIVLSLIITNINNKNSGVTVFDTPGQRIPYESFKVIQVLPDGSALAMENESSFGDEFVVLLLPQDGSGYYDNQIVKAPSGKLIREIGTFRYPNSQNMVKTVPIVDFFDQ